MNHMDHMNMPMGAYMAPLWLIYGLSAFFFAGTLFYLYRLVRPSVVRSTYGYYDWQNEIGHGVCMAAMAFSLAPPAVQLPSIFWAVTLFGAGAFFLVRAATWGRKLPYNKWWWDWAHVGMLLGMSLMFLPVQVGAFAYVLDAFWLWFAAYYTYELVHDLMKPKALYVGSDISHLSMGVVMFIMTVAPMALMPPGASMPGMICSPSMQMSEPAATDDPHAMHHHGASTSAAPAAGAGAHHMHDMHDMHDMKDMPGMKDMESMPDMPGMNMPGHDHGQPASDPSKQPTKP